MSSNGNTGLGLIAGIAAGAVLGLLYAPDKGVNTRKKLKKQVDETSTKLVEEATVLKDKLAIEANALTDKVKTESTLLKNNLSNKFVAKKQTLDEHIEEIVNDATYKADDVITTLETKLATLKAKNKKLQKKSNGTAIVQTA